MQFVLIHQSLEYSGVGTPLSMEGLQGWIIGITFRAAAVEAFRALRVKRRLFLQTRHQIRVSDVIAAKGHGIDQSFIDKVVGFLHRIGASADNRAREAIANFLTEFVAVRLAAGPVWFGHVQISDTAFLPAAQ